MGCQVNPHIPKKGKRNNRFFPGSYYRLAADIRDPPVCIPVRDYCLKYFLTRYQVIRLLSQKLLCGVSRKNRLFVEDKAITDLSC